METALSWLQGLSAPLQLILVAILLIVFKDDILAFIKARFGAGNEVEVNLGENIAERSSKEWFDGITEIAQQQAQQIKEMMGLMRGLQEHYNHETTELLQKISDGIGLLVQKHNEWEKYGIPTRECKEGEKAR